MATISASSLEYVRVQVAATEAGDPVDPTNDTVQMAFVASESTAPGDDDWQSASWETDDTRTPNVYYARCLVGPSGTVELSTGTYVVWVKITDSPEVPVKRAGYLTVTV